MKGLALIGVLLIVGGLAALAWPVISYTQTEKVLDIGPVEVTADRERHIPLPPIVGGLAVAAGIVLVVSSRRHA
jgi:uncharacterized membrane protein HdeD (DUF308 family)